MMMGSPIFFRWKDPAEAVSRLNDTLPDPTT